MLCYAVRGSLIGQTLLGRADVLVTCRIVLPILNPEVLLAEERILHISFDPSVFLVGIVLFAAIACISYHGAEKTTQESLNLL
jgi:hypothetical protein